MLLFKACKPFLKRLYYSHWPGQAGTFAYFGTRVHFQPRSHLFERICREDIYEPFNLKVIGSFLKPGGVYFDVGANIGVMSVPLLRECLAATVVSFEPSPNTVPYLLKTHAGSPFGARWRVIAKAVGRETGSLDFYCSSPENSAFDGLNDTGRSGGRTVTPVPVTTLDAEWEALGRPAVSVVKIDVEGAELDVLLGGRQCLAMNKPAILIEWNSENLKANNCDPAALLDWADTARYVPHSLPSGVAISTAGQLKLHMLKSQDFLLMPIEDGRSG